MEKTSRSALHPLLTVAAISIAVFSAIGAAALTGLIPATRGSSSEFAPIETAQPLPADEGKLLPV